MPFVMHTAQYRYSGPHRLDITVKGQHPLGRYFAPRWDMVQAVKKYGPSAHQYYIDEYTKILLNVSTGVWQKLFSEDKVVFVCFCPQEAFCHRNLLVDYILDRVHSAYFAGFLTS